jgi:predicted Zn-dependent peptidase
MPINIAFEKYTLSNGLDVILHVDRSIPVAAVNVWYHVGSQNEEPDRTGFAHLFEHIMFKGSKHHNREYFMPLQEVGASINGSTTTDRTNYFEDVPAEYLELALWLESDRMGFLLDALDEHSFEVEVEVVKNERRQSYENRPYGLAGQEIRKALFPPNHPYNWQTIGIHEHLAAATLDDVKAFFRRFYAPNNASLSIAGDIDVDETKRMVERYFGSLTPAPPVPRLQRWVPGLTDEVRLELEDAVQLARLYLTWVGPPRFDADEPAIDVLMSVLGEGRSSRLYRSLVYEKQIARSVSAYYAAMEIAGEIRIDATLAPGASLDDVEKALWAEVARLQQEPPSTEEVQRSVNSLEAHYVRQLESVGGFGGRADLLNYYNIFAGDPARLNEDFDRYERVTPDQVQAAAKRYLNGGRVRLVVNPRREVTPAESELDRYQKPGPGKPRRFEPPVPRRLQIAGGLDLLVVEKHEVPLIAAGLYFPGGAAIDPAASPGLSSMAGRVMTEGTKKRNATQIAEEADFIAAQPNIGIDRENVFVSTEALTRHWERALELLADVIENPTFPDEEIDRVRKERLTDLRRLRDDANAVADRVLTGLLYGRESPHGHPISGREEAIERLTREELVAQHERQFASARPAFLVVGDVDTETVARQLESAFSGWGKPGSRSGRVDAVVEREPTRIYLVDKPGAAQSVIWASQVSVPRLHPDFQALMVMNMAFGGQFTARLNMNLREDKGYTYGYRSQYEWRRSVSTFRAGGSVQTAVTMEALFETLKEFRDLVHDRPINSEEFEKAQQGMVRSFPPTFETPSQVLRRLLDIAHFELPDDHFSGQVARIQAVTLDDVQRVARERVDPDCLSIVIVGDRAVIEGPLSELGLPITHLGYEGEAL